MRLEAKRQGSISARLVSALRDCLPGAFVHPGKKELIALYRLRYRMAMDESKFDCAKVFLDKIIELEPADLEARMLRAELYHRHIRDYDRAVEHYTKIVRMTRPNGSEIGSRARGALSELIELLS